ncbi:hypothetical protein GCM10010520_47610 [Rhizobium viscosum]|uniref:J domain-containing protein n=1 Tax=Rhizobium viscosum TaxID=1673 RepID=A0ABR9J1Q7_RHIVS|nr:hypothetical protein [Rhizobium viscosum]MBE1509369.1 hypothetical protein [Rhizobium viscosum]
MVETCWTLLQIAPTQEEDDIRRAYARRLRDFRPDEDPEGFQRLLGARDAALNWANAQPADLLTATIDDRNDLGWDVDLAELPERENIGRSGEQLKVDTDGETVPQPESAAANLTEFPAEIETIDDGLVFERLREIVAREKARPWGADPAVYEAQPWIELFNLAAGLSLQRHEQFLQAVGRHFPSILPPIGLQGLETVKEFAQGRGVCAVVETIEQQCRFAERPASLVQLCGQEAAMIYFSWLAHAQSARGVLQRRAAGRAAYVDERTGLPAFPAEDRIFALETADLVKFHKDTVDHGRWPFRFDWKTLLIPTTRLAAAGLIWQGGLFLALLGMIAVCGFSLNNDTAQLVAVAGIPVLLVARFVMAVFINRLAVGAALQRVMQADRRGLWSRKPRPDALRNQWREYARPIFMGEFILSLAVLVSVPIMISTFLILQGDLDRPVETVVSEIVDSALVAVASDDRLPHSQLFELIDLVIASEQANFSERGKGTDLLVRDLGDRGWLAELRRREDQLLGNSWMSGSDRVLMGPVLVTPAAERERKLRVLADAYRSATPEGRMQIERSLAAWKLTLNFAKGPQAIAAVWAAIPPRTDGPNLDAFPEEMRRLLIGKFLANAVGNFIDSDVQLVSQFHWLLTVPADRLYEIGPLRSVAVLDDNAANSPSLTPVGWDNSDETGAARYFREYGDRPATKAPELPRLNAALARSSYFDVARTCLDLTGEADRSHMRQLIARSLANSPDASISSSADLWQTLGRLALADPACYRKVSITGRVSSPELSLSQLDNQFDKLDDDLDRLTEAEPDAMGELLQSVVPQEGIFGFTRDRLLSHAHFLVGRWFLNRRDYRNAILEFDQALSARECNESYVQRRQALQATGDDKRAETDLQLAFQRSGWCMIGGADTEVLRSSLEPLMKK